MIVTMIKNWQMVKSLMAGVLVLVITCAYKYNSCDQPFVIWLWQKDYSMDVNVCYQISNDSISVVFYSGGKSGKLLVPRAITDSQRDKICHWLSTHNIDGYREWYDSGIQDGDQKLLEFEIGGKTKDIKLSNYYLPDMAELFNIINEMVNKDLHIEYSKYKRYGGGLP